MILRTLDVVKSDFHMGKIKFWFLIRQPMTKSFYLELCAAGDVQPYVLSDYMGKSPKLFKSLDTAIATVEDIGFQVVAITRCCRD